MLRIDVKLFVYALHSLIRYKRKNIFIVTIFTLLVALLASFVLTQKTLYMYEKQKLLNMPDIVVQNQRGGVHFAISDADIDTLLEIYGVKYAQARVYGEYYFAAAKKRFFIEGFEPFGVVEQKFMQDALEKYTLDNTNLIVSRPLYELWKRFYYTDSFRFIRHDVKFMQLKIAGVVTPHRGYYRDFVWMSMENAQKIFGYGAHEFRDIALYLDNQNELINITAKLLEIYPNAKIITKEDMLHQLEKRFDYKGGFFVTLFLVTLFTFFMIVLEKLSGLSSPEKKEVGILKAVGWRVEDVLHVKLYEALVITGVSFAGGLVIAFVYVYGLDAPLLQSVFIQQKLDDLEVNIDGAMLLFIFLLSAPLYLGAVLYPSWRVATTDADEVMR